MLLQGQIDNNQNIEYLLNVNSIWILPNPIWNDKSADKRKNNRV